MSALGQYFPLGGVNMFIANMKYAADTMLSGKLTTPLQDPGNVITTGSATAILSAQSIASAVTVTTFLIGFTQSQMSKFGRSVTVVASGAATSTVTVNG